MGVPDVSSIPESSKQDLGGKPPQRLGIISHIVPPAGQGQSIVLWRLLSGLDPERYFLISTREQPAVHSDAACTRLPGALYQLSPCRLLPHRRIFSLDRIVPVLNFLIQTYVRMKAIVKVLKTEKCDVLIACSGDLYDIPAAFWASRRLGIPFMPYMFDDYNFQWTGVNRIIAGKAESHILPRSEGIIVPNESLQREYRHRHDVAAKVVHNPCQLPDLDLLDGLPRRLSPETFNIVYAGSVYHAHYDAFRNLISAIALLDDARIRLHIFTEQQRGELEPAGIAADFLQIHPHVSQSVITRILREADILFLPLAFDSPIHEVIRTSAPGKTGEYLATGKPVLVHAPADTFISWYFRENGCGAVVDSPDTGQLAATVRRIMSDHVFAREVSRKAVSAARRDFDIEAVRRQFESAVDSRIRGRLA
jgi:glycosyltransferase involved in cell wall biosynthesis